MNKFWIVMAAALASQSALAVTLDFEGFSTGQIIDDEYAPAVSISALNFSDGPDVAVVFDTENPTGGDLDLAGPFSSPDGEISQNYRPGSVLIIQERNNCNFGSGFCNEADDEGSRPGGQFSFVFANPITLQSLDFFDIEVEEADMAASQIRLFDEFDNEILPGTFFVPNTGGDNQWNQLIFGDIGGVSRLEVNMAGSGAIDNLTYVPVPAAAWLFGSGLLGLWGLRRRSRPADCPAA